MNPQDAIDLSREAIKTCMMVGGPILAISLTLGLLIGVFQAMTQVQDQTVSFVPKILLLIVAIGACLPWLSEQMIDFAKLSFERPYNQAPVVSTNEPVESLARADLSGWSSSPVKTVSFPNLRPAEVPARSNQESTPDNHWQMPNSQPVTPNSELNRKSPFILPHYRYSVTPRSDVGG